MAKPLNCITLRYDQLSVLCLWATFAVDITPGSSSYMVIYIVVLQLPLLVPFFPITISCIISFYKLRKKGPFKSLNNPTYLKKQYASTTIIIVTIIYIVLNFPVCVQILLEVIQNIGTYRFGYKHNYILEVSMSGIYIRLILAVYCVGINAAINPIVYFFRFKGFQKYSRNLSTRIRTKIMYSTAASANRKSTEMESVPGALAGIHRVVKYSTYTVDEADRGSGAEEGNSDDRLDT